MNPSFFKKKDISILALMLLLGVCFSCKKDSDTQYPTITVHLPIQGAVFQVGDTIHLEAYFHDNSAIEYVKVTLNDCDKKPVLPSVYLALPPNPYSLNTSYAIVDSLIESGIYELQFQVFDGSNTTNAFVSIQVVGLPRYFRYPVLVTRPFNNNVNAYLPDSSGEWKRFYSRQGDYGGACVNSTFQYLYISGAYSADLDAVNLGTSKVDWSIAANQLPVHHWFEDVSCSGSSLYISYYAGYIKAIDKEGVTNFTTVSIGNYYPQATCEFDNWLAATLKEKNSEKYAFAIYSIPGGNLMHFINHNVATIALFQADKQHLLSFGNRSGSGIIEVFNSKEGTLTQIYQNENDSIYRVDAMDSYNYLLTGKTRLYWYSYDQNSLTEFVTGIEDALIACESLGRQVFAASNNKISVYSFPEGILEKTIPCPEGVVDILLLYNK